MTLKHIRTGCTALALVLLTALVPGAEAADLEAGSVYCFQAGDFGTPGLGELTGACITGVPGANVGTVTLGSRTVRPGDILTAGQLDCLQFTPSCNEAEALVSYLPIYGSRVEGEAQMTFSIHKKEDQPPVAEDMTLETYKNLPNEGRLKGCDPEGGALTYTIVTPPKRGDVTLGEDGSFTYTPKKNKVGSDCFTYTVTDEAGQVSQEAKVSVKILKPLDSAAYRDMEAGQFEALWMRNTGLFSGTQVAGEPCFGPDEPVSRGEFLAMVMKLLDIPPEEGLTSTGFADEADAPDWLLPYLGAAMRLGIVSGSSSADGPVFRAEDSVTFAEAAVMVQNVLMLPAGEPEEAAPAWAGRSMGALAEQGICLGDANAALTRADAASLLYHVRALAEDAPGMEVFHRN